MIPSTLALLALQHRHGVDSARPPSRRSHTSPRASGARLCFPNTGSTIATNGTQRDGSSVGEGHSNQPTPFGALFNVVLPAPAKHASDGLT